MKNKKLNTKDDGVFRVFFKTNSMKTEHLQKVELDTNEVFESHYGNIVDFNVMEDSVGKDFELYEDGELKGEYTLISCDRHKMSYERV